MVKDAPPFSSVIPKFQKIIGDYQDKYLVAHNNFYDMKVLENHGIDTKDHKWLCTWRLAKKLFNGVDEIQETNLPYLRFALKLDVPITMRCHRAGNDSYMTGKLLEVLVVLMEDMGLIDPSKDYGDQIYNYLKAPIIYDKMPFGKHKGELMTNVPLSYWQWAIKNMDTLREDAENFDNDLYQSILVCLENQKA